MSTDTQESTEATLVRSSYAIPAEQKEGVEELIVRLGLPSLAQLLGMLSIQRNELVAVLQPFAVKHMQNLDTQRAQQKAQRRIERLQRELKRAQETS
jgi:hypothetical protein